MTNATLKGKPYARNPHVRFEVGGSRIGKPRRGSLLYKKLMVAVAAMAAFSGFGGWNVSDVHELTNALAQVASGETILVHPGTYDLSDVWMSVDAVSGKGVVTNHLAVSTACEIRGETDGHWADAVVFKGRGRGLKVAADVAVKVSGITFDGFRGGDWSSNDTSEGDTCGAGVRFNAQYDAASANHGRDCCLTNCVIRNCYASHGAAVFNGLAVDCLIEKNEARIAAIGFRTQLEGCLVRENKSTVYYGLQDTVGVYDTVFTNNLSYSYGAVVCLHGATYTGTSACVISNCQFLANLAGQSGGVALTLENLSTATAPKVMDCVFRANGWWASGQDGLCGSAIGCSKQGNAFRMSIDRCTFDSQRMPNASPVVLGKDKDSVFVATGCTFTNNYATGSNGAVFSQASVFATNCVFAANTADGGSAAAAAGLQDGATGFFKGCTFLNNASYGGGALWYSTTAKGGAEDCVFVGNDGRYNGGAVCCDAVSSNLFVNCTYRDGRCSSVDLKSASVLGGAGVYGGVHSNCVFTGNSCKAASALAKAVAIDCVISNNPTTGNDSWGVAVKSRLVRCDINNGGIWFCSLDRCRIHDVPSANPSCVFHGANWATNCLVTKCYGTWGTWYRNADAYDYLPEEGPTVVGEYVNCTIADNCHDTVYTAICYDGFATYSNLFENCILYGNHMGNSFTGGADDLSLYVKNGMGLAVGLVRNCLVGTFGANTMRPYDNLGGNLPVGTDPCFAKDAKPGVLEYYAPLKRSPTRDYLDPAPWMATATDLIGSNRVFNAKCDLGCYEYCLPSPGALLFLR